MTPYYQVTIRLIAAIMRSQAESLERAAQAIFESLRADGVFHVFGSGHSHALAEEAFHRAGGLVPVNAIQEAFLTPLTSPRMSGQLERVPGLAKLILDGHDLRPGEVLMVISNSGINAVPVEIALEAKARGLTVIALTSLHHSQGVPSRHGSGKRLFEIADIVLDNCGEPGDAAVGYEGFQGRVGPTSLLAGAYIINSLVCRVVELFLAKGLTPPVYLSANLPGGDEHNRALEAKYRGRIRGL
ncbi:MAG: SIS domain-containing protein, partial [candidate division NC10 bacterium]